MNGLGESGIHLVSSLIVHIPAAYTVGNLAYVEPRSTYENISGPHKLYRAR